MQRYRIEKRLGAGGMAEVFRAVRLGAEGFARPVALKKISAPFCRDPAFAEMFIKEARIAALLDHPNIVGVLDFDRDETGALFLAMELIDGCDAARLAEAAKRAGALLDAPVVAFIGAEVLRALEHAHGFVHEGKFLGILHRDVSPHNVLVSRAGAVKLADFGIAKAMASSNISARVRGKIAYMSPEQAMGVPLDGRSDLFALGATLYELLSGKLPFKGTSDTEILAQLLDGRVIPLLERAPDVPRDLAGVVDRLLAIERDKRFPDALSAQQALIECACYPKDGPSLLAAMVRELLDLGALAPRGPYLRTRSHATVVDRRPRRRRLALAVAAALVSAGAAALVWILLNMG